MPDLNTHPLATIEPRMRWLLPADLHAAVWVQPDAETLGLVFDHLRTLRHILYDYLPRLVVQNLSTPGNVRWSWHESTLMFTDLAGFTPLLERYAGWGHTGATLLLEMLNDYFAEMLQVIHKSGGELLEFTGDAMLVQFPANPHQNDTTQAVRAGLRMQRAMARFRHITTEHGPISLGMRIGVHHGRYLAADIGTPRRMENVLLGGEVQRCKHAEGAGTVGAVCLTEQAYARVQGQFAAHPAAPGYVLIEDTLSDAQLGEYDLVPGPRRLRSPLLFDRSVAGLYSAIAEALDMTEALAAYLPRQIVRLLVESAGQRHIRPEFPDLTVLFVTLKGLPGAADVASPSAEPPLVLALSRAFALINAAVDARGGVLKNATCDHMGSSMLMYFGVPDAHTNDSLRAAAAAVAIRAVMQEMGTLLVGETPVPLSVHMGLTRGPVFAAEVGEPRGRREFNILGDTVNTAARLMGYAAPGQILVSAPVQQAICQQFACEPLAPVALKGKAQPMPLFALHGPAEE